MQQTVKMNMYRKMLIRCDSGMTM